MRLTVISKQKWKGDVAQNIGISAGLEGRRPGPSFKLNREFKLTLGNTVLPGIEFLLR